MKSDGLTIEEILGNIEKGLDTELEAIFGDNRVFPVDDDIQEEPLASTDEPVRDGGATAPFRRALDD